MPELRSGEWYLFQWPRQQAVTWMCTGTASQIGSVLMGTVSRAVPSWVPLQFRSPWQWDLDWVGCLYKHIPSP